MSEHNTTDKATRLPLRIDLQHFAESGAGNDGGANEGGAGGTEATNTGATDTNNPPMSTEALDKYIQSKVDKATADFGKKIADLQKENTRLKNEGKTAEEIKNRELADRDKAITEKEQALLERENRLFAIKAIKEAELDDGGAHSLELADFVIAGATSEEDITKKVKSFKSLVDKFVEKGVSEVFKKHGRTPNGAKGNEGSSDNTPKNIAEKIGKERAERDKMSNDVLSMYTKRR